MMGLPTNQANLEEGLKDWGVKLDVYEKTLGKQKYTAGDVRFSVPYSVLLHSADNLPGAQELSLVDLYHLVYAPSLQPAGVDILQSAERPNVKRCVHVAYASIPWMLMSGVAGGTSSLGFRSG